MDGNNGNGGGGGNQGPGGGGGNQGSGGGNGPGHGGEKIKIKIDRETFEVDVERMTGYQLRLLPKPPIGPERDLFEVVPGGSDRKIADADVVELKNGMRFFTARCRLSTSSS